MFRRTRQVHTEYSRTEWKNLRIAVLFEHSNVLSNERDWYKWRTELCVFCHPVRMHSSCRHGSYPRELPARVPRCERTISSGAREWSCPQTCSADSIDVARWRRAPNHGHWSLSSKSGARCWQVTATSLTTTRTRGDSGSNYTVIMVPDLSRSVRYQRMPWSRMRTARVTSIVSKCRFAVASLREFGARTEENFLAAHSHVLACCWRSRRLFAGLSNDARDGATVGQLDERRRLAVWFLPAATNSFWPSDPHNGTTCQCVSFPRACRSPKLLILFTVDCAALLLFFDDSAPTGIAISSDLC